MGVRGVVIERLITTLRMTAILQQFGYTTTIQLYYNYSTIDDMNSLLDKLKGALGRLTGNAPRLQPVPVRVRVH